MPSTIIVCKHCGDSCTGEYCRKCSTLEKRLAQDEANAENYEKNGLEYKSPCTKCEVELEAIENKKKK